jgi:hypothetical protein
VPPGGSNRRGLIDAFPALIVTVDSEKMSEIRSALLFARGF